MVDEPESTGLTLGRSDHVSRGRVLWVDWESLDPAALGQGIPAAAVPLVDPRRFRDEFGLHDSSLLAVELRSWHPAWRFVEELSYCADQPDVEALVCLVTTHVPVLHFHMDQVARAQRTGFDLTWGGGILAAGGGILAAGRRTGALLTRRRSGETYS